ncbi:hypothetical protein ZIOFF_054134 [Zingiber officinale]|uniref:Uncharacterized protein n=1 Tax=Zingiber officinale TaxID=94328 RepID=A0A8J5FDA1_ZINOF|nr:hypothetical protein ZIOFF_054134 [Zingiber officinale]
MDPGMEQLRQTLVEVETEAEELLLARHQEPSGSPIPLMQATILSPSSSCSSDLSRMPPCAFIIKLLSSLTTLKITLLLKLDFNQEWLVCDTKKLQSYVKEKSLLISKRGALADWISPDLVKSMVTLTDTPKST